MTVASDMTGTVFGRLTVLERAANTASGQIRWICKCVCGNKVIVQATNLKSGATKSCGCLNREKRRTSRRTHGLHKHPLYQVWKDMRRRCRAKNHHAFADYGGRGIRVCAEWESNFSEFYKWAMTKGYRPGLSVDRKENNGPYSPENCQFSTRIEQNNNKRSNRIIKHDGKRLTLSQWAAQSGISMKRLSSRLKAGWTFAKAITTPTKGGHRDATIITS